MLELDRSRDLRSWHVGYVRDERVRVVACQDHRRAWPPEDHRQACRPHPDVAVGKALQGARDRPGWLRQRIPRQA